ncbi:unnamed protein product [Cuscuta epithymum]|uniref:Uncharacterized protein n=1 Tax=Cuscuta epithymum TaxID=186058 RepID=A0AAV0DK02_9ASTE|nr:unnamed protein product [Cuscuta epithymum]
MEAKGWRLWTEVVYSGGAAEVKVEAGLQMWCSGGRRAGGYGGWAAAEVMARDAEAVEFVRVGVAEQQRWKKGLELLWRQEMKERIDHGGAGNWKRRRGADCGQEERRKRKKKERGKRKKGKRKQKIKQKKENTRKLPAAT